MKRSFVVIWKLLTVTIAKTPLSIQLCNTEWLAPLNWEEYSLDGFNFQKSPNQMSLQENQISWNYAMNAARILLMFQRLGGDFEFANFNNMANTWGQNILECPKDALYLFRQPEKYLN